MSDIQNRFIRVLVSGILGWLLARATMFLSKIGIDPTSETGKLVIEWIRSVEPVLIIVMAAAINALIGKIAEMYPNMSWLERFLNPFNNRVPTYFPPTKIGS
jgi:hypothetical protein